MKCSFLDKDENLAIRTPPGGCSERSDSKKIEKSSKIQGRGLTFVKTCDLRHRQTDHLTKYGIIKNRKKTENHRKVA